MFFVHVLWDKLQIFWNSCSSACGLMACSPFLARAALMGVTLVEDVFIATHLIYPNFQASRRTFTTFSTR